MAILQFYATIFPSLIYNLRHQYRKKLATKLINFFNAIFFTLLVLPFKRDLELTSNGIQSIKMTFYTILYWFCKWLYMQRINVGRMTANVSPSKCSQSKLAHKLLNNHRFDSFFFSPVVVLFYLLFLFDMKKRVEAFFPRQTHLTSFVFFRFVSILCCLLLLFYRFTSWCVTWPVIKMHTGCRAW